MAVLCFDIGIKNLAWCLYKPDDKKIIGWQNYDLINDDDVANVKELYKCSVCNKNAHYTNDTKYYCAKHISKPIFKDLSGNVLKKMPNLSIIKEITKQSGKKDELYDYVKTHYCTVIEKKKAIKKMFNMEALHDSIRKFVLTNIEQFRIASAIGLENQPVLKNPVMKTVQVMLYATLRDILHPNVPKMRLIHAGKKVKGMEAGEAGYKDRKTASVERAKDFLKNHSQLNEIHSIFESSVKKNDLSDALSMCIDY